MRPTSALVVAAPTLLSLGLGSPLTAQQIVPLTDAPFSARLSVTENEGRTYAPRAFPPHPGHGSRLRNWPLEPSHEHTHRPDNPFAPSRSATTRPSSHHGVNPVTAVLRGGHSCPPPARQSGASDSSEQRKNERPERRWAILT